MLAALSANAHPPRSVRMATAAEVVARLRSTVQALAGSAMYTSNGSGGSSHGERPKSAGVSKNAVRLCMCQSGSRTQSVRPS
jgi:hypothetical protein